MNYLLQKMAKWKLVGVYIIAITVLVGLASLVFILEHKALIGVLFVIVAYAANQIIETQFVHKETWYDKYSNIEGR